MDVIFISRKYYTNILRRNHLKICQPWQSNYSAFSSSPDNPLLTNKLDAVKSKVYDFMKWYEQLTGIDEIRIAQNKVIEAQDRFAAAQEKRREVTLELNEVKNKIKDLQEELSSTSRGEERYITLITKEHKFLKDEIRLTDKFNLYEREERELFTTLTSAVKDSHEKERIQANKTKYLSIIGSVVGALIGIAGSTLNNRSKIAEFKKMVLQSTEGGKKDLESICKQLEQTTKTLVIPTKPDDTLIQKLDELSHSLQNLNVTPAKNDKLESSLTRIEKNLNSLVQHQLNVSPEVEEIQQLPSLSEPFTFTNIRDDISYAVISCFSVYFLYKLLFS